MKTETQHTKQETKYGLLPEAKKLVRDAILLHGNLHPAVIRQVKATQQKPILDMIAELTVRETELKGEILKSFQKQEAIRDAILLTDRRESN